MMKQLDFFFDFFSKMRSERNSSHREEPKTLVAGGKREAAEVLFLRGHQIRVRRRAYQRNLSLSLRPNGSLQVVAGRTMPLPMITKFVLDSWDWVEKKKLDFEELRVKFPEKKYEPGEIFKIQGRDCSLRLVVTDARHVTVQFEDDKLTVRLPRTTLGSKSKIQGAVRLAVRNFYEEYGRTILAERLQHYSQELQLYPQSVSFRCQRTRWGSCSANGHISLNWRLAAAPLEVIDYVVIHELCHLKFHNHSQNFWRLVETQSRRWRKIRRWLHENQFAFDFLTDSSDLHPELSNS